jgi:alanine dehydrogenase
MNAVAPWPPSSCSFNPQPRARRRAADHATQEKTMIIGVPREIYRHEHRVGLTPMAAARLIQQGHTVFVEKEAGLTAHFSDRDYQKAGAQIVYNTEEVYKRADMVCRFSMLPPQELDLLKPGVILCGFLHLAVAAREMAVRLMDLKATLIGYEIIRGKHGDLPVLVPFSEMAGHMSVHIAAQYLQNEFGGRGVLIGGVTGVPPATVLILGAGTVGGTAARIAVASGAHVIVCDADLGKLRALNRELKGQVVTVMGGLDRMEKYTSIADVVIGAVLIPGGRAPFVLSEEMVKAMKPGSVIIDVAIDQGGCVETSRPMSLDQPTFVVHNVVHYCVPNMTANIARTSSRALANAAIRYITGIAGQGLDAMLRENAGMAAGVYMYKGRMINEKAGSTLGIQTTNLRDLL